MATLMGVVGIRDCGQSSSVSERTSSTLAGTLQASAVPTVRQSPAEATHRLVISYWHAQLLTALEHAMIVIVKRSKARARALLISSATGRV